MLSSHGRCRWLACSQQQHPHVCRPAFTAVLGVRARSHRTINSYFLGIISTTTDAEIQDGALHCFTVHMHGPELFGVIMINDVQSCFSLHLWPWPGQHYLHSLHLSCSSISAGAWPCLRVPDLRFFPLPFQATHVRHTAGRVLVTPICCAFHLGRHALPCVAAATVSAMARHAPTWEPPGCPPPPRSASRSLPAGGCRAGSRTSASAWLLGSWSVWLLGCVVALRCLLRRKLLGVYGFPSRAGSPRSWSLAEARLRTRIRLVVRWLMGNVCVTCPPPGVPRPTPTGVWCDVRFGGFVYSSRPQRPVVLLKQLVQPHIPSAGTAGGAYLVFSCSVGSLGPI